MTRLALPRIAVAAFLAVTVVTAGAVAADPADRGSAVQINPDDRPYLSNRQVRGHGRARANAGNGNFARLLRSGRNNGGGITQSGRGNRASITQTGNNNTARVTQRGDNKHATVIQRGNDTDVYIDQHGEGPGGALVITW